jgi:ribosome-associated heat shock protein Hsp15
VSLDELRTHPMVAAVVERLRRLRGAETGRTVPELATRRHHRGVDSTRVDRWLWAVRLTKTRPDAVAACRAGHVRVNDRPAKPATTVAPGDEIRARIHDTTRIVEVVRVIQRRVGAADAVTCYLDRTPPPEPVNPVGRRDRGAGRPTKRERRVLDAFREGRL